VKNRNRRKESEQAKETEGAKESEEAKETEGAKESEEAKETEGAKESEEAEGSGEAKVSEGIIYHCIKRMGIRMSLCMYNVLIIIRQVLRFSISFF